MLTPQAQPWCARLSDNQGVCWPGPGPAGGYKCECRSERCWQCCCGLAESHFVQLCFTRLEVLRGAQAAADECCELNLPSKFRLFGCAASHVCV
jgi:hypothetical protein